MQGTYVSIYECAGQAKGTFREYFADGFTDPRLDKSGALLRHEVGEEKMLINWKTNLWMMT